MNPSLLLIFCTEEAKEEGQESLARLRPGRRDNLPRQGIPFGRRIHPGIVFPARRTAPFFRLLLAPWGRVAVERNANPLTVQGGCRVLRTKIWLLAGTLVVLFALA